MAVDYSFPEELAIPALQLQCGSANVYVVTDTLC